jgi:hypothetical protein
MRPPRLSDTHLLECQRRLDDLVDHPHRPGSTDILRTLHLALADITSGYEFVPSLPDTDAVLHRRWRGHGGVLSYLDDPLLTAALIKIATRGGLRTAQSVHGQMDMASWSSDGFPRATPDLPSVNRFGGTCRAVACLVWVPPGYGVVAQTKDGPLVLCSKHADRPATPDSCGSVPHRVAEAFSPRRAVTR